MKKEQEKIKLSFNIGGEHVGLNVDSSKKDFHRAVENEVNNVFFAFRNKFPNKSDREILAMVTFRYALYYNELKGMYEDATSLADQCLALFGRKDSDDFIDILD